jgi:hypothetical protein
MGLPPWLHGAKQMVKKAEGGEIKGPPHDHHALHAAAAEMMTHISKNDSLGLSHAMRNFVDLHMENKAAMEKEAKDGIGEG